MSAAGASQYTFHVEATDNIMECINRIKSANMKVMHEFHFINSTASFQDIILCSLILLLIFNEDNTVPSLLCH